MSITQIGVSLRTILGFRGRVATIERGRWRTRDVAFPFRMGGGFAGDINRTHPFDAMARMPDATSPPKLYGIPILILSSGAIRMMTAGDSGLSDFDGISVRPYPFQGGSAPAPFGAQGIGAVTPPTNVTMDYLIKGFMTVPVVGSPLPRGTVYVWTAAASGSHVQGGFEAASPGGSGFAVTQDRVYWNSQADSSGIAEIAFNV
jgi:hypothetical protein